MAILNYGENDLSLELAVRAFRGTSFDPDKRGARRLSDYMQHMAYVDAQFSEYVTDENKAQMAEDLEVYRLGYVKRLEAYLQAHSRIVSTMIAGPSGFPTSTMEKRNETCDRRLNEWLEWSEKRLEKLRDKYDQERIARAPIMSDDPDAIEKLTAKLEAAQRLQDTMKAANKIIRGKLSDEEKVAALVELDGIDFMAAHKLLLPEWPGPGFAQYQLTNNNANIKRMQKRIDSLKAKQGKQYRDVEYDGVTVHYATELDRLQLIFEGKPSAEVRDVLKSNGFRWAPSQNAWQRQLTSNAISAATRVLQDVTQYQRQLMNKAVSAATSVLREVTQCTE